MSLDIGIGYKVVSKNYALYDLADRDPIINVYASSIGWLEMPITGHFRLTTTYLLAKNWGLNLSIGVGQGGVVNAGILYKVNTIKNHTTATEP